MMNYREDKCFISKKTLAYCIIVELISGILLIIFYRNTISNYISYSVVNSMFNGFQTHDGFDSQSVDITMCYCILVTEVIYIQ
jgi:hypothetical protein